ncbi:hypothetical protein [Nannocystis sp. SCPEA4]|uniref:hypothetical protein n=1 Tax=Nannocystis sp. SCPEA4 TaxID=2996787 RepID=UPI00226E33FD|nr:hypothetical protein [Nannocystis sp. SCPEA4]MCY1057300.1 hypothetical protein [Nannocystis sp. SCPEA4]
MTKGRGGTVSRVLAFLPALVHCDAATRARATPVVPAPEAAAQASEAPPAPVSQPSGFGPPGRYAVDVHKTLSGTHGRDLAREDSRASFVLELEPNGQASACRGIRSYSSYDGDSVHNVSNTRQQQGYRGRWQMAGEWVQVELGIDDTRCAKEQLYENLAPRPWHLRCRKLEPAEHGRVSAPLLACALENEREHQYRESFAYFVPEVIAGEWLLLAPGDGLRVNWHDDTVPPGGNPPKIELKPAQGRVADDTWMKE